MSGAGQLGVLFVCLGNICRSPTAHGVLRARLAATGLAGRIAVASAGTGDWHVGKPPDRRATAAAAARGIDIGDLRARQLRRADLQRFDYVLAMDGDNLRAIEAMAATIRNVRAHIALLGDYSRRYPGQPVPDPFFGGEHGFERVLDRIENAADGLEAELRARGHA